MKVINRGDKLFWARIVPCCGIYEVHDLHVRTVGKDYYVGVDKHDKHAYLLGFNEVDENVFDNRLIALRRIHNAEQKYPQINGETYYEEY